MNQYLPTWPAHLEVPVRHGRAELVHRGHALADLGEDLKDKEVVQKEVAALHRLKQSGLVRGEAGGGGRERRGGSAVGGGGLAGGEAGRGRGYRYSSQSASQERVPINIHLSRLGWSTPYVCLVPFGSSPAALCTCKLRSRQITGDNTSHVMCTTTHNDRLNGKLLTAEANNKLVKYPLNNLTFA